jgi:response regulator of citrate/malate metabolism
MVYIVFRDEGMTRNAAVITILSRGMHMPTIRHPRSPLPPRLQQVLRLLRDQSPTIAELANILQVTPDTARSYVSAVAKHYEVHADFEYGSTRYHIEGE